MALPVCPQCHQAVGCKKIVVFIDGTSMGFGKSNSMMLKLAGLLIKDSVPNNPCPRAKQICRYIAGLGGKLPRKPSFKAWLGQKADIMFAVNFSEQVCDAYRFLCDQYEHGDMIYLFGFSRGAYQVRTLAAMVEEVGLVDDKDDIEEAWSTYVNQSARSRDRALRFKHQSSHRREDVPIRFVGIWDTVSSIGGTGVKTMPFVSFSDNVERYRHALALDETRGRFVPEYVDERRYKVQPLQDMRNGPIPRIKEVWFVGSHSNVGGSHSYKLGGAISISGNWMLKEATDAGLQFHESDDPSKWQKPPLDYFGHVKRHAFFWNLFELAPSPLRDPRRPNQKSYLVPHFWRRRILLPTQKVHLSAYVWCLTSGKTPYEVFEGTTRPVWIPHTIFDIPHAIDASLLDHVWFEECHIDAMYAQIDFPSSEQDLQSFVILSALKVASPATFGFDVPSEPLRQKLDELMTDDVEYHSPGILRFLSVAVAVLVWLHYNSPNPSPAEVAVIDRTLRYLIRFGDLKVQYTSMRIIQFFLSLPSILRHMHYPSMADDIREYVQRPKRVFDRVIPKKSVVLAMMLKDEVLELLQRMLEHHDAAIDQQPMTDHDRPQEGAQIASPPRIDISEEGQAAEAEQIGDEHAETEENTSEDADGDMDNGQSGEDEPATSVDIQAGSSSTTSHEMVGAEFKPSLVFLRPQVVNGGNED